MNKKWLEILSKKVEEKYGLAKRDHIFGDIPKLPINYEADKKWIHNFIRGINNLCNKDFANLVMKNLHHIVQDKTQVEILLSEMGK
ncbi:MAG: hypothetical protein FWC16_04035 [Defluviitaleaceae bacterium]|nr:hypothetical protein [Defluviitaleaceae bacterium]MCL2274024.1 hypothetical protein [Defluviitaleaceae bacterium]MCL2274075.1 hypothetical protein [Defluviitaleaceae bacterium]